MLDCKVLKDKAALLGKNIHNARIFKEYIFWDDYGDNDCNGDDDDNDTSS